LKITEYYVVDDLVFNESIFEQEDFLIADDHDHEEQQQKCTLECALGEESLEGISASRITDRLVYKVSDKDVSKAWKLSMKHLENMTTKSDPHEPITSTLQELRIWDLEYLGSSVAIMIMQ